MSEKIISSPEFRLRLIDLEYKNLNSEDMEAQIKQIYLEECGELLEGNIEIYHSSQPKDETIKESGYDGTAIHIDTDDKEEVYVISQGTQDMN